MIALVIGVGILLYPVPSFSSTWLLYTLAAMLLDLLAARTPAGWLSPAAAVVIAMARQVGFLPAALAALAGLGGRKLLLRTQDNLIEVLPLLLAALLPDPLAIGLVYFLAALVFRPGNALQRAGIAACGVVAAMAEPAHQALSLFAAVVIAQSAQRIPTEDSRKQAEEERLKLLEESIQQTGRETARLAGELGVRQEELQQLELLALALGARPSPEVTMARVIRMVRHVTQADSVVIFMWREEELVAVDGCSPHEQRVKQSHELKLSEPIIQEALQEGRPLQAAEQPDHPERIFPNEKSAIALPLRDMGVLYVGDSRAHAFSLPQTTLLSVVAELGAVSLEAAQDQAWQEEVQARHDHTRTRLKRWRDQVARLLEGSRMLATTMDGLDDLLADLFPHDARLTPQTCTGEEPLLEAAARAVAQSGQALLIEELEPSRFGLLCQQARSLLAVPLPGGQAIVLASNELGAFQRMDQDLLYLIGYQTASAIRSARLLQELEDHLIRTGKLAAMGRLAAGVAHEINTPLGVMRLGLDSALKSLKKEPAKAEAKIERVLSALDRTEEIVSRLLRYSRGGPIESQDLDLNQVVRDTLEFLSHHMRTLTVETELCEACPVRGNPNELQQVLVNLLMNAREAGTSWIAIRTIPGRLEVSDRGAGMSEEVRGRLFEPFFTTREEGTGLGLWICRQLAERNGATLSVTSRPGQGATFVLEFTNG